jgi:hypothetical protein
MSTAVFCFLVSLAQNVCGQEALRLSLAGDAAARANREATATIGYYNLLLGPVAWRFSSGLGLAYNDNVQLQEKNQLSDFIFRPKANAQMHWPVTERNSLDVALGVGYSLYLKNQNLNQFNINPGSGVSFDIYTGDFAINLHDRIYISENSYENPGANGNGNNARNSPPPVWRARRSTCCISAKRAYWGWSSTPCARRRGITITITATGIITRRIRRSSGFCLRL